MINFVDLWVYLSGNSLLWLTVTLLAYIAADAISAARPVARNQDIENYVERMESLEESIAAFAGVDHVYAMASGRELRVAVKPDVLSDEGAAELARTLVQHIEKEASFAGEIKVTIIRETRVDVVAGQA